MHDFINDYEHIEKIFLMITKYANYVVIINIKIGSDLQSKKDSA